MSLNLIFHTNFDILQPHCPWTKWEQMKKRGDGVMLCIKSFRLLSIKHDQNLLDIKKKRRQKSAQSFFFFLQGKWNSELSRGRHNWCLYPCSPIVDTWSESLIEIRYLLHLYCQQRILINSEHSFVLVSAFFLTASSQSYLTTSGRVNCLALGQKTGYQWVR